MGRNFRLFWAGETVSLFGSQITVLALPLAAISVLDAGAFELGLLGMTSYLPFLILALPAGIVTDRCRRRPLMIAANLVQAAAIGLIPLLVVLGELTLDRLLAAAFAAGAGRVFFELAYRSYLPSLVPTGQLTAANARLSSSESLAEVGGPAAGGWLVSALGAPFALLVDAVSFVVSTVTLGRIDAAEPQPGRPAQPARGVRAELADSFRFTFASPYLRAFLGEAATYNLFWQIVQTLLTLYAVQTLGLSPAALGLVLAVGSAGALLGAVLAGPLASRIGLGRTVVAAAVVGDAAPLVLPFVGPGPAAAVVLGAAFFVRGIGITGCNVHVMAIRQTVTPHRLLGRTVAAYQLVGYGVIPIGALAGGVLGQHLGLRPTLLLAVVGLLSTCLWLIFSPVRRASSLTEIAESIEREAEVVRHRRMG